MSCQVYFAAEADAKSCGIDEMHSQKFYNSGDVTLDITNDTIDNWTATAKHDAGSVTYAIDKNGRITP